MPAGAFIFCRGQGKESQMLRMHGAGSHWPLSLRQKGLSRSLFFSGAADTRAYVLGRGRMQHVLPIGRPSVVDNSLLADRLKGEPAAVPYMALHGKFVQ